MIITQKDIDDFVQAYRRFASDDEESTWDNNDVLTWLATNPQVMMATGYQEFVAGANSRSYQSLTSSSQLDDISRPLFRSFDGTWVIPSSVSLLDDDPWYGFRLDALIGIAKDQRELDREKAEYWNSQHFIASEFENRKEQLDRRSVEACSILMPSFEEMINAAAKLIDNPLIDQTTWVSPKLWTPDRQQIEKSYLQNTAADLISELRNNDRDLADIHWREFEEIVAELLRSKGMDIHLVRENPQGGRDIIARAELVPGSELVTIAIEVKHREVVDRPILEQAIHQNRHFPALMLVTSGRFTAGVLKEAAKPENRMRVILKNGIAIRDLVCAYRL